MLALLAFLFHAASAQEDPLQGWQRFSIQSTPGSIRMPGTPAIESQTRHTVAGPVVVESMVFRTDPGWFSVTLTTVPKAAVAFTPLKQIFNQSKGVLLHGCMCREERWEKVRRYEFEGRRLSYAAPPTRDRPELRGMAEFYFRDHTVLTIDALQPPDMEPEMIVAWFDSIRRDLSIVD